MKAISNILVLFMAASGMAFAQAKSGSGFLRIVNAVSAGTGRVAFAINGRDVYADGYALGQTTGEYGVKTGDLVITTRKTGVETGRTNIQLMNIVSAQATPGTLRTWWRRTSGIGVP